jgi:hypothetical protein
LAVRPLIDKAERRDGGCILMSRSETSRVYYSAAAAFSVLAAAAIFWKGRSVYRHLLFGESAGTPSELAIISVSVVVIQTAYWAVLKRPPPFRTMRSQVLGTVVLFLSRISFMLAGALFSIVVFVRFEELHIRPLGYLLFVAVLFTIFCFSRWLEAIGRHLEKGANPHEPAN